MVGLQIKFVLRLLTDDPQVRPQRGFGDGLGVVVVVLLPLHEGLHVDCRNDPRLMSKAAQRSADKMRAEAGLQPDDARRQLFECLGQRQPLDLAAEGDFAITAKSDEMKHILADIDPDHGNVGVERLCLGLMAASPVVEGTVFAD